MPKHKLVPKEATEKLPNILRKKLSYKEICAELGLERKSGNSKIYQLEELRKYCSLTKIEGTQKFYVSSVFGGDVIAVANYLDADESQLLFDAALYREFLKHPDEPLFATGTELLLLFNEINRNFLLAFEKDKIRAVNRDFVYMSELSMTVYRILHQWAMRRIDDLDRRRIVLKRRGFRLYRVIKSGGDRISQSVNVHPDTDLERRCQTVWNMAANAVGGGVEEKGGWMPEGKWNGFKEKLEELTKAEFAEEGYTDMRAIYILSPISTTWLKKTLKYILDTVGPTEQINEEAKQKILYTTQLDKLCSNNQRREFISFNIDLDPPYWFIEKNPHEH